MSLDFDAASFVVAFAAGFVSCISPCVLPLVPGYLSFVTGVGFNELADAQRRVLNASIVFFAGFAATFTLMGAGAGALGDFLLQNRRPLEVAAGAFLILMALVLLGVRLPLAVVGEWHPFGSQLRAGGRFGTGVAFAIGWTPCIGPTLAAVLTLAASGREPLLGAALLLAYAAGLAVPFIAGGLFLSRSLAAIAFLRRHQRAVSTASAALLVVFAVLLATGELTRFTQQFVRLAPFGL